MPYEFVEDGVTSDVTFRAWGDSLDELFTCAAEATMNAMVSSLDSIRPRTTVAFAVTDEQLDLLLMRFLEELIFHKDAERLLLRPKTVRIESGDGEYRANGELHGEEIEAERHDLVADVKAVTLHRLRVEQTERGWEAEATLDV